MRSESDDLDRLLDSVTDGSPVNWDGVGRDAAPRVRGQIAALRDISRIASFHESGGDTRPPMERWGDLLLLDRLGAGANAEVYRAWDPTLQREVALKLMRARPLGAEGESPLLTEGRAAARVRHPNVVTVHGVASHDGRVGLWMELIAGPTLEQAVLARGPLSVADALRLGRDVGSALAAAHDAGLVHRDVKPANVMIDAQGRFVLSDFGLGTRWGASLAESAILGTPMYLAPECLAGEPATPRSDLYSLGLTLWFALAGRHPHAAATVAELRASPRPPEALARVRADVPRSLAEAVAKASALRPEDRFVSVREWVDAMGPAPRVASTTPGIEPVSPRRLVWALLAATAVIVVGVAWYLRGHPPAGPAAAPPVSTQPGEARIDAYDVEASFQRRTGGAPKSSERERAAGPPRGATTERLTTGDRVRPGDRLSLRFRATRPTWVYVLNEDDRGERFLLFPQPLFDRKNPLPADADVTLPGTLGADEIAWEVTSRGGRERFLVVASLKPVPELEEELARLPAAREGRAIRYAPVPEPALLRLRGTGGIVRVPPSGASPEPSTFDQFRALAEREAGVRGVWVREIAFDNP